MANRCYATLESVKSAVGIAKSDHDADLLGYLSAGTVELENVTGRRFIPETATKYYPWPQRHGSGAILYLCDDDLLALTTLQAAAQDASPTALTSYFLEPVNKPPYTRVEIDLSGTDAFAAGATPQRSISVLGRWAYSEATVAAGTVASGLDADATVTTFVCSNASLIGVGDTLLIGTEALFVSAKALTDTGVDLNDTLTDDQDDVTVTLDAAVNPGEIITIDSEEMLVESIATLDHTVQRAVNGSLLAAHNSGADVYAPRSLTGTRGENGTTAAVHADDVAISKYQSPEDVSEYVKAYAIAHHKQATSGWTGEIGGSDGARETRMFGIWSMREALVSNYKRVTI